MKLIHKGTLLIGLLAGGVNVAMALDLRGSVFEEVGVAKAIDPHLLYSVALAESARGGNGGLAPHPYTLRVADQPGFYAASRDAAEAQLREYLLTRRSVDVGMMQVNLHWHGHRVNNPSDLLDPVVGLSIGADILREAIESAPGDMELGIGRYYTWSDDDASRRYGERVLSFYHNIKNQ